MKKTETPAGMQDNLPVRKRRDWRMSTVFMASTMLAIVFLLALVMNILNGAFGLVAWEFEVSPASLAVDGVSIDQQSSQQLQDILNEYLSLGMVYNLEQEKPLAERSKQDLLELVKEYIAKPRVAQSWNLWESLVSQHIMRHYIAEHPGTWLEFRSWVHPEFLTESQSNVAEESGIRTALFGSLWTILIAIVFAFPIGVGAAVYLEEYADKHHLMARVVQVNIYNLAGVPSIIYGLLGLVVFVRFLEPITSGALFGLSAEGSTNGRTILSAGLTLGLLVLPIIIINAQEAIRAVPQSLRHASYGVGATKWQTIRHHVLPASMDRILTGTILALSRAIGETAPIVVVGASTFISMDPEGVFSKFTTLPIQIYQWTARPQAEYRNAAAAAIVVLLVLLLSLNAFAIFMRNRISEQRRQG